MKLLLVRDDMALEAHKPAITTLKEQIAIGVAALNVHASNRALNSYEMCRARVNTLVDQYIELRKLTIVKG